MKIQSYDFKKDDLELKAVEIIFPNTTLLLLAGYDAFFMCGALNPAVYGQREVICGCAKGVKTIDDLFEAQIYDVTNYAKSKGIDSGMKVYEAFSLLKKE